MIPKVNQLVSTPNGPGICQGVIHTQGQLEIMVSYAPETKINPDLCQSLAGDGKGAWWLATYLESQVSTG
jgi:hypothetical protein